MILLEIDFSDTEQHVDLTSKQILSDFDSGKINKHDSVKELNDLYQGIKTHLMLSEIPLNEKSKYSSLLLSIKLYINYVNGKL